MIAELPARLVKSVPAAGVLIGIGLLVGLGWNALRPAGAIALGVPVGSTADETSCAPPAEGIDWIDAEAASRLVEGSGTTFADARDRADFNQAHVVGAVSMPMGVSTPLDPRVVDYLRGARAVVTYCDTSSSCARSTALAKQLRASGLAAVRVLRGGFPAWLEAGYPAESGICRFCPSP